jgi:hypothetical protein
MPYGSNFFGSLKLESATLLRLCDVFHQDNVFDFHHATDFNFDAPGSYKASTITATGKEKVSGGGHVTDFD